MTIKSLRSNVKRFFENARDKQTEAGLYAVATSGMAVAKTHTPIDTSTLINSEFSPVFRNIPNGMSATVGFNAEYAIYVHEAKGILKGKPRSDGNGNYWSPDASPQFLKRGFDEIKKDIPKILKAVYETK